jgi:CRISPR-associated protein Csb1
MPEYLTFNALRELASGGAAALRWRRELQGIGGDGDKVFPPTYAGGVYAVEDRRIDGKIVRCALLDSVQSQANRMEELLLDAFLPNWRELDVDDAESPACDLPLLAVHVDNHGWVTSLTAPHRIHDAIIRDSEIEECRNGQKRRVRFRESTIGQEIVSARAHNATAFFQHCPTALIFGTWDSTAGEGLHSAKIPRAVVSEIIGVDITPGVRTASRIDPLGIRRESATIYRLKADPRDWAAILKDENDQERYIGATSRDDLVLDKKNNPRRFGEGKPSDINHGNVTPDIERFPSDRREFQRQNLGRLADILQTTPVELRYEMSAREGRIESNGLFRSEEVPLQPGAVKPGGITMAYALHAWTLSLTQLRRLRFPTANKDQQKLATQDQRDEAARTVLAALALYALTLQQEKGYWLRSRCELVPNGPVELELVGASERKFALGTAEQMRAVLDQAIRTADDGGLSWSKVVRRLTPTQKLRELVSASDLRGPELDDQQEPADAGVES